jgi:ribosomal protein S18 acetylase RimI-like enzyme
VDYVIRSPEPRDADDLGRVHVRAWQAAYRGGLMPDEYLDGLSAADRASMWREALGNEPRPRGARLAAEAPDGTVVGFAIVGPAGGDQDADGGELYAINVDPEHWGLGAGQQLLASAVDALRGARFPDAVLWVHPGNARARRFYETHGWVSDEVERDQEILGVTVAELRYSLQL